MDLHAVAAGAGVLVPGGRERAGAEADAGQSFGVERLGELFAVEPGRAEELERTGGAAAFRQVRSLEQAQARIEERGVRRGHVGRGHHPRQAGLAEVQIAAPATHFDNLQIGALANETRVLAGGHSVAGADRPEADERFEAGMDHSALDLLAADGIGPVEHDEAQLVPGRRLHGEAHGGEVGVVAAADVLDVEDQRVEAFELLLAGREGCEVLAVERMRRNAGARVAGVGDLLEILQVAAHAVLGAEERRQRPRLVQHVGEVAQVGRDAGGIEDGADAQASDCFHKLRDAEAHHQYAFRERKPKATVRARMRRSSSSDQCSM